MTLEEIRQRYLLDPNPDFSLAEEFKPIWEDFLLKLQEDMIGRVLQVFEGHPLVHTIEVRFYWEYHDSDPWDDVYHYSVNGVALRDHSETPRCWQNNDFGLPHMGFYPFWEFLEDTHNLSRSDRTKHWYWEEVKDHPSARWLNEDPLESSTPEEIESIQEACKIISFMRYDFSALWPPPNFVFGGEKSGVRILLRRGFEPLITSNEDRV